jgi:16S rRNA (adenine1518-N6/adenine1519-N6)-dimethyltransferase
MRKQHRPPLGQVFLQDSRVERRILDALCLSPEDAVLEIGAGPGNMTARIAAYASRMIAVEVDPKLAAALRLRFADNSRVSVLEADILQVAVDELARQSGKGTLQVFGNLPYYITSPCLMHLFRFHTAIRTIVVMVQLEVAQRIVAEPSSADYGLLSVTCQYYTRPELLFRIPPGAFRPRPGVHSALVRMNVARQREALGIQDEPAFWNWMRAAFAQKRKTLVNNWKGLSSVETVCAALEQMGVSLKTRAEALSLEQLAGLYLVLGQEHAADRSPTRGMGRLTANQKTC